MTINTLKRYAEIVQVLKYICSKQELIETISNSCTYLPINLKIFLINNIETKNNIQILSFLQKVEDQLFLLSDKENPNIERYFFSTRATPLTIAFSFLNIFSGNVNPLLPLQSISFATINKDVYLYEDESNNPSYVIDSLTNDRFLLRVNNLQQFQSSVEQYNNNASSISSTSQIVNEWFKIKALMNTCKVMVVTPYFTYFCGFVRLEKPNDADEQAKAYYEENNNLMLYSDEIINRSNIVINKRYKFDSNIIIRKVSISNDGKIIAVATNVGGYFSLDYGFTFTKVNTVNSSFYSCAVSPKNDKYILFGTENNLLVSTNNGTSFSVVQFRNVGSGIHYDISLDQDSTVAVIGVSTWVVVMKLPKISEYYEYGYSLGTIYSVCVKGNGKSFAIGAKNGNTITVGFIDTSDAAKGFIGGNYYSAIVENDIVVQNISMTLDSKYQVAVLTNESLQCSYIFSDNYGKLYYTPVSNQILNNVQIITDVASTLMVGVTENIYTDTVNIENVNLSSIESEETQGIQTLSIEDLVITVENSQNLNQIVKKVNSENYNSYVYFPFCEDCKEMFAEIIITHQNIIM